VPRLRTWKRSRHATTGSSACHHQRLDHNGAKSCYRPLKQGYIVTIPSSCRRHCWSTKRSCRWSNDNVLKYGSFWKLLSDLRTNGVRLMLLYRTQEFKTNCFKRPKRMFSGFTSRWIMPFHAMQSSACDFMPT
jgi:hypothetical protein